MTTHAVRAPGKARRARGRADESWDQLRSDVQPGVVRTIQERMHELPDPARRFLCHAVPAGVPLGRAVIVAMDGELKLGPKWLPFRAEQLLRPGAGFVWRAHVGGRVVHFDGADVLVDGRAQMDFRLLDRVPVARAEGPDVVRSALGRLAGETVLWAPHALLPGTGARWRTDDDGSTSVSVPIGDQRVDVSIEVAEDGSLRSVALARWNDSAHPPREQPFGGPVLGVYETRDGLRIAGSGSGGWGRGTPTADRGEFFRYRVVGARTIP